MDIPYHLPDTTAPDIVVRRSAFGNISVLVNGQAAKRTRGLAYAIPMPDGTTTELKLSGQWSGLKATANGVETALEPPVNPIYNVLIFLPIALVVIGGAIGAAIGVVAAGVNLALSRRPLKAPLKLGAMLGVIALAVVVWFGSALAIVQLPRFALATCVNGIKEGATLTTDNYKVVDCSTTHDNEVVGIITYTASNSYPGDAALEAFSVQPCLDAFKAYVGIDFNDSQLGMLPVIPSDVQWAKGNHDVACIVYGPNNLPITSSVKGSGH